MWIFSIVKIVIAALVDVFAIVAVLCGIIPRLPKWIQSKGEAMTKKNHWLKRLTLIVFGGLMTAYFTSVVVTGIKGLDEQSLRYQNQMILKYHVKNFATDLSNFAKHYDQYNPDDQDTLHTVFAPELSDYKHQLSAEGVRSTNLENLFDKSRNLRTTAEYQSNMTDMASDLIKMANELPKSQ